MSKSKDILITRSSAAEYLTFIAASGTDDVEAVYADDNIWITQKMMALLYDVDVRTVNCHLIKVFTDSELQENSVFRNFRIAATDKKLQHQALQPVSHPRRRLQGQLRARCAVPQVDHHDH